MALINCEECGKGISTQAESCVHCGAPISDRIKDKGLYLDNNEEKVIAEYVYTMFDAAPFWFLLFVAASLCMVGIILLVIWSMFVSPRPRLTITDRSLIYKDMSMKTHIVNLQDIEKITVGGSFFQKIIKAGWLIIDRKGFLNFPILMNGLSDPESIKNLILKHKS